VVIGAQVREEINEEEERRAKDTVYQLFFFSFLHNNAVIYIEIKQVGL
jgi:hypothetical protein